VNKRSTWLLITLFAIGAAQLRADSVTLKTGEKISGTIKAESATDVTIDVPVSASITDERVIKKDDIAQVDKAQPDQIAYQQLIAVQPNPDLSLTPDEYDQILTSLNAFIKQYPGSTYLPEIQKLAGVFQDEKNRVEQGQLKYMGEWLSKADAAGRQIQIDGIRYYDSMVQQAAAGDFVSAMQTYDVIEKKYVSTRSYPAAVQLARTVLSRLQQDLASRMQQVKADQAQLQQTILATAEPAKSNLIVSAREEQDRASATVAAAIRAGQKWTPLIPRSQVSVDTLQKTVTSEASRIASIQVEPMIASIQKVDAARSAFNIGDYKTADALLKDASTLWAQNEAAKYWSDRVKSKLASASPTPKATPKPSVRPTPQPVSNTLNATPAPASEEDKPFYMTISGAATIAAGVLVIGGIVAVINQRKSRKQPE
jgi:hypothetical protein